MKTSARNSFTGTVSQIRTGTILSEVEVKTASGLAVVSVITNESKAALGVAEGKKLTAIVKAPWVILVKDSELEKTSARNRYQGTITAINEGSISAEVIGKLEDGTVMCALITDESVKKLGLKVGEKTWFLFKAFSVILNAE
ncbi:molybdenum-pterin binding protein [Desulfovibrio sp. X2]|uniref:TOBE domain-containing protein n=1 Tax=Desulfovibrio sp. X2 TaxID=941449 RepID=UPI000358E0FB|nr:TOBE domain-containing protein [Desulfovibrio sp. X2]EPR37032.1 molybdenum-pterin binding protein [Desulfovibrio sp. X2]